LAYTVMASPWLQRRAGAMLTYIATSPEREDEARDAMLQALGEVSAGRVSEGGVDPAPRYAAASAQLRRQTSSAITSDILSAWLDGRLDELPELPARLRAVTVDDVVRESGAIFRADARAEFVVKGTGGER